MWTTTARIKSADVQRWLKPKKRRRFHFHFTPTSSSWLNQVERWFGFWDYTNTDLRLMQVRFYPVAGGCGTITTVP